jgi:hypothetical protein
MKKFVFRFKKTDLSGGIQGLTNAGVPISNWWRYLCSYHFLNKKR